MRKAGDSNYVSRGIVHRQQNLSDKPARCIVINIRDKGKPVSAVAECESLPKPFEKAAGLLAWPLELPKGDAG